MKNFLFLLLIIPATVMAQDLETAEVKKAAMAYLDGMYKADPQLITEVVHPELLKLGFYWKGKNQDYSELVSVSYKQFYQIAKDWNKDNWLPKDAIKEVEVLDIQEKIASAKVTSYWGIDYLHLVKMDDKWSIVSILWQNYPGAKKESENDSSSGSDSNN